MLKTLITPLVLATALVAGCTSGPPPGQPAPDFTATAADGTEYSLAALDGQVLILDFWAVW